jgi:iron complex outermembrane receptor protein
VFYNQYDDIRTTSLSPTGGFPAMFQNGMEGDTWGTEIWGEYKIRPWWRLSPGFSLLRKDLHLKPGVTDVAGIQTAAGHDPGHQVFLRSYMDLPHDLALYVDVRHVGGLANVSVDPYFEADVRLGWRVSDKVELSIAGNNLVHAHHAETPTPPPLTIPRSFYANIRLFF